jgi:HD-like signal output (HDOD) protein/ActR/RegA family two-component response regulator
MKRILFVDDDKNVLEGIQRMLRSAREYWQMEFVRSGAAALQACREGNFDVVVSDLRMPDMDGATLLARIRDEFPGTARIILSGYSEVTVAARAVSVAYRVLLKPCDSIELRNTIERVCALQDVFCTPALRRVVGTVGELPSLSSTYSDLSRALQNPVIVISEIAKIIEKDLAMSAKILQLVNSAFFGLPQKATNLEHAVAYLGLDMVRNLALYSETFRVFVPQKSIPEVFIRSLQEHSQRSAIIAGALPVPREFRENAIVASLLHDVGTLVLASTMPEELSGVLALMRTQGCLQYEAEEASLGISHAEIGAYLLGLWGINNIAVEAIAHHHHPTRITHPVFDCSVTVYLANLIANELALHPDDIEGGELSERDSEDLKILGYSSKFESFRASAYEALIENGMMV